MTFKNYLLEFGPMAGGRYNDTMGSKGSGFDPANSFDGKQITFELKDFDEVDSELEDIAKANDVKIRHKYYNRFEIQGKKKDIQEFLSNNPKEAIKFLRTMLASD